MLIRFTVGNFLSFNEPQEFSMIKGKVQLKKEHVFEDKNINLLKLAAIYGANASGKSNLINAMEFAQKFILGGIPTDITSKYCRINKENKDKPSYFDFEIKIDEKYYSYGFELIVNSATIVNEWLYEIGSNENLLFERSSDEDKIKLSASIKGNAKNILKTFAESIDLDNDILFLTEMNRNKEKMYKNNKSLKFFENIYNWFDEKLIINSPNQPLSVMPDYMDEEKMKKMNKIISSLGLGVKGFHIVDENPEKLKKYFPDKTFDGFINKIKSLQIEQEDSGKPKPSEIGLTFRGNNRIFFIKYTVKTDEIEFQKLQLEHENNGIYFDLEEESDGTCRMLDLIEILFAAGSGSDNIFVIDEIDRSLHPQLTYRFVESYLNLIEKSKLQLIFTTHESHILDLNLLRRDEIWFVEKNQNGESSLYSLEQYNPRFDKKIRPAYLDGRYGAIPKFDDVFPMKVDET